MPTYNLNDKTYLVFGNELYQKIEPDQSQEEATEILARMGGGLPELPEEAPKKRGRPSGFTMKKKALDNEKTKVDKPFSKKVDLIRQELRDGKKASEIAKSLGVAVSYVYKISSTLPKLPKKDKLDRDDIIVHPSPTDHMETTAAPIRTFECPDGHTFKSTSSFEDARCPECWKRPFVQR